MANNNEEKSLVVCLVPGTIITAGTDKNPFKMSIHDEVGITVPVGVTVHKGGHSYKLVGSIPNNDDRFLEDVFVTPEQKLPYSTQVEMNNHTFSVAETNMDYVLPEQFEVVLPKDSNIITLEGRFPLILAENTIVSISIPPPKKKEIKVINWNRQLSKNCSNGNLSGINECLMHNADINNVDYEGFTPLYHAILKNCPSVVQDLVERDVDIIPNHLNIASTNRFWKITNLLLRKRVQKYWNRDGLNTNMVFDEVKKELLKFYSQKMTEIYIEDGSNNNLGSFLDAAVAYLAGDNVELSKLFFGNDKQMIPLSV